MAKNDADRAGLPDLIVEKANAYGKKWREKNREKALATSRLLNKKYWGENREKYNAAKRDKRAGIVKEPLSPRAMRDRKLLASKKDPDKRRISQLRNRYKLSDDRIMQLLSQKACEICGETNKRFCVDHCHASGAVRGMLCSDCNISLGFVERQNGQWLGKALAYLKREIT